jgi:hypothetical protein
MSDDGMGGKSPVMKIYLEADGLWPDLAKLEEEGRLVQPSGALEVAYLEGGMASGAASVAIRIPLPDGRVVFAQTSVKLWLAASAAFQGRAKRGSIEISKDPS